MNLYETGDERDQRCWDEHPKGKETVGNRGNLKRCRRRRFFNVSAESWPVCASFVVRLMIDDGACRLSFRIVLFSDMHG